MKKGLGLIVAFVLFPVFVYAGGFRVYYGTTSGVYTLSKAVVEPGQRVVTIYNLTPDVMYYFAATARSMAGGESAYSNEVSTIVDASGSVTLAWDVYTWINPSELFEVRTLTTGNNDANGTSFAN